MHFFSFQRLLFFAMLALSFTPFFLGLVGGETAYIIFSIFLLSLCLLISYITSGVKNFFFSLLYMFVFYNLILSVFSFSFDVETIRVVLSYKEFSLVFFGFLLLLSGRRLKITLIDGLALLFLIAYFIGFFHGGAPLVAKVVSLREGIVIVLFYFLGRIIGGVNPLLQFSEIAEGILAVVFSMAVVGTIMYFFTEEIFRFLGVLNFIDLKYFDAKFFILFDGGLPNSFSTYIFGAQIPRLVGPILDATATSRIMSVGIIITIAYVFLCHKKGVGVGPRIVGLGIFMVVVQVLSIGRGGILISFLGVILILGLSRSGRFLSFALSLVGAGMLFYFVQSGDPNTVRHIDGLMAGFSDPSAFGFGLGSGGQLSLTYASNLIDESAVKESYFGALVYQCGLFGLIAYSMFFITLSLKLFKMSKSSLRSCANRDDLIVPTLYISASATVLGAYLTSVMAQSAISFLSIMLPMILAGYCISYEENRNG